MIPNPMPFSSAILHISLNPCNTNVIRHKIITWLTSSLMITSVLHPTATILVTTVHHHFLLLLHHLLHLMHHLLHLLHPTHHLHPQLMNSPDDNYVTGPTSAHPCAWTLLTLEPMDDAIPTLTSSINPLVTRCKQCWWLAPWMTSASLMLSSLKISWTHLP